MKPIYFLILSFFLFSISSCDLAEKIKEEDEKEKYDMTATEYNNFVIGKQNEVIRSMLDWLALEDGNYVAELEKVIEVTNASIKEVEARKPYPGAERFKDASLSLFEFYAETFSNDYMTIAKMIEDNDGYVDEEMAEKIGLIVDEISKREEALETIMQREQEKFAKANNVVIVENELQEELDALAEDDEVDYEY